MGENFLPLIEVSNTSTGTWSILLHNGHTQNATFSLRTLGWQYCWGHFLLFNSLVSTKQQKVIHISRSLGRFGSSHSGGCFPNVGAPGFCTDALLVTVSLKARWPPALSTRCFIPLLPCLTTRCNSAQSTCAKNSRLISRDTLFGSSYSFCVCVRLHVLSTCAGYHVRYQRHGTSS